MQLNILEKEDDLEKKFMLLQETWNPTLILRFYCGLYIDLFRFSGWNQSRVLDRRVITFTLDVVFKVSFALAERH